jgi:hypothetical protein
MYNPEYMYYCWHNLQGNADLVIVGLAEFRKFFNYVYNTIAAGTVASLFVILHARRSIHCGGWGGGGGTFYRVCQCMVESVVRGR